VANAPESHDAILENGLSRLMRTVGGDVGGAQPSARRSSAATARRDTILYIVAAVLVLIVGYVHLKLYFDGYRDVPNANLGRSFIANAVASVVVAVGLVALRNWIAALAALALANATMLAFWISRTDRGVFGFTEHGFKPSPEATIALVCEIGVAVIALVLLAEAALTPASGAARSPQ